MWVVICTYVWMMGDKNKLDAMLEYYPEAASRAECQEPVQATRDQIEFYKSVEFKPKLIATLDTIDSKEFYDNLVAEIKKDQESFDVPDVKEAPSPKELQNEALPDSAPTHKCRYWWTSPSKDVYKLNRECVEVKS